MYLIVTALRSVRSLGASNIADSFHAQIEYALGLLPLLQRQAMLPLHGSAPYAMDFFQPLSGERTLRTNMSEAAPTSPLLPCIRVISP